MLLASLARPRHFLLPCPELVHVTTCVYSDYTTLCHIPVSNLPQVLKRIFNPGSI
jgi:hypothetical protein